MMRNRFIGWLVAPAVALAAGYALTTTAEERPASQTAWEVLHRLIKPEPGESRWMEIDWHPTVWEARQKAAAEGKPIFIMAGSGGAPAAGC